MSQQATSQKKTWTRPELVRLGKIGDVAGQPGGSTLNGINSSRT